jgi:hypothetical protein
VCAAPAQASLSAVTEPATTVTDSVAVLHGTVEPSGSLPTYYFEYGLTDAYGAKTAAIPFVTEMKVQALVSGLLPATTYHFRVVAKRPDRVARGADRTFTTLPSLFGPGPIVTDPGGVGSTGDSGGSSGSGGGSGSSGSGSDSDSSSGSGSRDDSDDNSGSGSGDDSDDGSGSGSGDDSGSDDDSRSGSGDDDSSGSAGNSGPGGRPELGETVGAAPSSGTIAVRSPGQDDFVPLEDGAPIPVGSTVDARRGSVKVVTALGEGNATQSATFRGAIFQVRQKRSGSGMTDIVLRGGDFSSCGDRARVSELSAARSRRRPVRRLWGRDHNGSFRTHGRGAIATVRATTWVVADRCGGTVTRVREGAVSVRDKRRHRTVLLRAGQSYFARTSR